MRHAQRPPRTFTNRIGPVHMREDGGEGYVVRLTLFSIEFMVDLTPELRFVERALGMRGFSPIPLPWVVIPYERDR